MALVQITCARCGAVAQRQAGHVNRSVRLGRPLYCTQECAGLARRKSEEEKKARLAEYDRAYRQANRDRRRQLANDWNRRNPEKGKQARAARVPYHVEYCRRPEYKEYKRQADIRIRMAPYGEFGEAYRILLELEKHIRTLYASGYERRKARGYYENGRQDRRKRKNESKNSTPAV